MNLRDRWPLRRQPDPPGFEPADPAIHNPIAWQRATPVEGWMILQPDPRIPTPTHPTGAPHMTEPDTEHIRLPEPIPPRRPRCEHCGGPLPTINDRLRESIALISDAGDQVVADFYARLFAIAPTVRKLFPPDLLDAEEGSDTRGFRQRDQLVKHLVAVAQWYDPFDPKAMQALDTALQTMGRRHHSFAMPDGTVFVPEREHYDAVTECLIDALSSAAGGDWLPEYERAWRKAMADVGDSMRHYARLWQSGSARLPRESAEPMRVRRRDGSEFGHPGAGV